MDPISQWENVGYIVRSTGGQTMYIGVINLGKKSARKVDVTVPFQFQTIISHFILLLQLEFTMEKQSVLENPNFFLYSISRLFTLLCMHTFPRFSVLIFSLHFPSRCFVCVIILFLCWFKRNPQSFFQKLIMKRCRNITFKE